MIRQADLGSLNFSYNKEYIQVLIFGIFKYAYKDYTLKFLRIEF